MTKFTGEMKLVIVQGLKERIYCKPNMPICMCNEGSISILGEIISNMWKND